MCDVLVDFTHNDLNVGHHLDPDCMEMVDQHVKAMFVKSIITSSLVSKKTKACLP